MRCVFIVYLCIVLFGCKEDPYPGFKKVDDYYYKVHELGDEQKVKQGNYIRTYLVITSLDGDTIHYVPDYPYFLKIDTSRVAQVFSDFHEGDSGCVILKQQDLKKYFNFFHLSNSNYKALLHFRINEIYTSFKSIVLDKEQYLKHRSKKQNKALMELINSKSSKIEAINGIYREMIKEGNGVQIKKGNTVDIHYRGKFTNGYVFDDTYERKQPLSFTYGKEEQVLKGVNFGIKNMKEGNKFKIYIPSQLGFGSKGSLAGIVPPNTSIIYEIEIIKVKNQ